MPTYIATSIDRAHVRAERMIEADDEFAVRSIVEADGSILIDVEEHVSQSKMGRDIRFGKHKVKPMIVSQFSSDLATRLASGIDLARTLNRLAAQRAGTPLGDALDDVNRRLRTAENTNLPDAFWAHEDVFGKLFCALFAAGFKSGRLAEEMDHAAELLADRDEAGRKVMSALISPAMLLVFTVVVTIALVSLVLPVYKTMFTAFGGKLPLPTVALLDVYNPAVKYWYVMVVILIALFAVVRTALSNPTSRYKIDTWLIKAPKVGDLLSKSAMYRLTSTLSGMMSANINIFEGLYFAADTCGNMFYQAAARQVADIMRDDAVPISEAVRRVGIFPSLFVDSIQNGEEAGNLVATLRKYVKRTGSELKTATESFQQTVQPLVTLFVMVIVGAVVLALVAPQYQLIGIMSKAASGG
jgi:type IV pilus assembly protein PilC